MSAKDTAKKIGKFMFLTGVYNQRNIGSILLVLLFAVLYVVLGGRIELRPLDQRGTVQRARSPRVVQEPPVVRTPPPVAPVVSEEPRPSSAAERLRRLRESNRKQTGAQ